MSQMRARFNLSVDRLTAMVAVDEAQTQMSYEITLYGTSTWAEATGNRQHIMFLIGLVANQGEDCLVYAVNI